jgi:hypothetical protein
MSVSEPSQKAVLIAIGGLVIVPAAALIAVVLNDRGDTAPLPEPAPAAVREEEPVQTAAPAPPVAQAPIPRSTERVQYAGGNAQLAEKLLQARRVENTDPKRSRELLREVLAKDPKNEQALEGLALKTLLDEDADEARELAARCAKVNSRNSICEKVNKLTPAITPAAERMAVMVEKCARADPNNVDCVYGKLQWLLAHGKKEEAQPIAEHLAEISPKAPATILAQARLKAASGEYGEARRLHQTACEQGNQEACTRAEMLRGEGW